MLNTRNQRYIDENADHPANEAIKACFFFGEKFVV